MTVAAAMALAVWLGVQTSLSPCTLAGNVAAISFLTRRAANPLGVLLSGLFYVLGRAGAYVAVAVAILTGLQGAPEINRFLATWLNQLLGPVLIVVGLVLLGWLGAGTGVNLVPAGLQKWASRGGPVWALVLGILLALSFCPVSAGLFFGALLPLARSTGSTWAAAVLFGLGTAGPVVLFAILIAFAAGAVGKAFAVLQRIEKVLRILAGAAFIAVGVFYCLLYIYQLPLLDF